MMEESDLNFHSEKFEPVKVRSGLAVREMGDKVADVDIVFGSFKNKKSDYSEYRIMESTKGASHDAWLRLSCS